MSRPWRGVPLDLTAAWTRAFQASRLGNRLDIPCPACGCKTLNRHYTLDGPIPNAGYSTKYVGSGGLWEWCSSCWTYEHSSALVPIGWRPELLHIDESKLTAEPEALQDALEQAHLGSG